MDYDSFKTTRDDHARDGVSFDAYLAPADLIDSAHPAVVAFAQRVAGRGSRSEEHTSEL